MKAILIALFSLLLLRTTSLGQEKIKGCKEVQTTGIYILTGKHDVKEYQVLCERKYDGGGWLVIQRRMNGRTDFYRPWDSYKMGFGSLDEEFWLGLDRVHKLTKDSPHELMIVLYNVDSYPVYAKYDHFVIGSESENYTLKHIGVVSGSAGDSLTYHLGQQFTTYDRKNDGHDDENCAFSYHAGWWFRQCYESNLNGLYAVTDEDFKDCDNACISWRTYFPDKRITSVLMMIRPSNAWKWIS